MLGMVSDLPETRAVFSAVAFGGETNSAFVGWAFKDWAERERSQAEADPAGHPGPHRQGGRRRGVRVRAADAAGLGWRPADLGGDPSTGEASQVFEVAEEIKNKAQASGRFIVVQNSMPSMPRR